MYNVIAPQFDLFIISHAIKDYFISLFTMLYNVQEMGISSKTGGFSKLNVSAKLTSGLSEIVSAKIIIKSILNMTFVWEIPDTKKVC
jgi:hypothetical protein